MIKYKLKLDVVSKVSFDAIPDKKYNETMNELEEKLYLKMIKNQIIENRSMQIAKDLGNFESNKTYALK